MEKYSSHPRRDIRRGRLWGLTTNQVLYRLIEQYDKSRLADVKKSLPAAPKRHTGRAGVIIKGFDDLLVRFAGCCNPVPGDTITGFISRGRGISIHRSDCPNLRNVEKERLIEAQWTENKEQSTAPATILAHDSPGLIAISAAWCRR